MLWESVVGKRMWDRSLNDMQVLHGLMNGTIPRPRDAAPDVDERLERIIVKATSVKQDDRYATATEMQIDLDAYLRQLTVPPFGARDLGKFARDLFHDERAQLKKVIDGQIRALRAADSGGFVAIDMPRLAHSGALAGTPSGVQLAELPRRTSEHDATVVEGSAASRTAPRAPAGRSSRRRALWLVLVGIVVVGGVCAAVLPWGRGERTPEPNLPSASAATATPTPSRTPTDPATVAPGTSTPESSAAPEPGASATKGIASAAPSSAPGRPGRWRAGAAAEAAAPGATSMQSAQSTGAPTTPAASATHVRQQIDTSSPYGHE
jgi:hypothetical protein